MFLTIALGGLAYQVWAVKRRPPFLRTRAIKTILWASLAVNLLVIGTWIGLWFRYH